jgi:hypothetical protein
MNAETHTARSSHSPFVPVLLMGVALVGWLCFQTVQLVAELQRRGACAPYT